MLRFTAAHAKLTSANVTTTETNPDPMELSMPHSQQNGDIQYEAMLVDVMHELIDDVALGLCFEVHRACKHGTLFLGDTDPKSQREHEIVDRPGVDVFGHIPTKKQFECVCPNCQRNLAASRFAPHLEKCMGMGRNSSRIASRRQAAMAKENEASRIASVLGDESPDDDNDLDWSYHADKKIKKLKKDKLSNSPRRNKMNRFKNGDSNSDRSGTPEPSIPSYELMSLEERKQLLLTTCGVISEHTKKMCTRSHKCPQHTEEQRQKVRNYLLGNSGSIEDEINIDIDSLDDAENQLMRENLQWEAGSNASSPADSTSTNNSTTNSKKRLGPKVNSKGAKKKKPGRPSHSSLSAAAAALNDLSPYDFE